MLDLLGVRPSYHTGFAQWAGMSEYPELWKGLVGAWDMSLGQTGNKVFDLSGNGNHGVFSGDDVSWGAGKYGPTVLIGSSQDNILCSGAAKLFNPTEGTIELFVKPNWNYDDGVHHFLFSTLGGNGKLFSLYKRTDSTTRLTTDSTVRGNVTFDEWATGQYYHVFLVWGINKLYINNILVYDYTDGGLGDGADNLRIGDHPTPNTNQAWNGDIEWVRVWNHALSPSEIALLYQLRKRLVA